MKNHGANSLFVKSHPKSKNIWADAPLNPDPKLAGSVTVYTIADLANPDPKPQVIDIAAAANLGKTKGLARRAWRVQQGGDEIWFSVWTGNKTEPSAIVVVDDKTRTVKTVIKDPRLVTPTGKFNVTTPSTTFINRLIVLAFNAKLKPGLRPRFSPARVNFALSGPQVRNFKLAGRTIINVNVCVTSLSFSSPRPALAASEPPPERQRELVRMVRQDLAPATA